MTLAAVPSFRQPHVASDTIVLPSACFWRFCCEASCTLSALPPLLSLFFHQHKAIGYSPHAAIWCHYLTICMFPVVLPCYNLYVAIVREPRGPTVHPPPPPEPSTMVPKCTLGCPKHNLTCSPDSHWDALEL